MNVFDHKDLGNHLLQLCPKVVKHSVYKLEHSSLVSVSSANVAAIRAIAMTSNSDPCLQATLIHAYWDKCTSMALVLVKVSG